MTKEEEKRPMISIGVTYDNIMGNQSEVDETLTLEAYLIASALFCWTLRAKGLFCWLIDHIKISFYSGRNSDTVVSFKITLKPLNGTPDYYALKIEWFKIRKTLESPFAENTFRFDDVNDCVSKDQVIDGIKNILHEFIVRLSKEKMKKGQYLEKLSQTIKEKM